MRDFERRLARLERVTPDARLLIIIQRKDETDETVDARVRAAFAFEEASHRPPPRLLCFWRWRPDRRRRFARHGAPGWQQ